MHNPLLPLAADITHCRLTGDPGTTRCIQPLAA